MPPVEQRHREWFLDLAERAASGIDGAQEGHWAARVDRDLDNFRAAHGSAVRSGDLEVAARLVAALREYSFRRVRYEIASWGEATMQMEGFARSPSAPIVVAVAAYGRWVRGDLEEAIELAHRSVALTHELGVSSTGLAERVLGNALFFSGETREALAWMQRMVTVAEEIGSPADLTHALYMASVAATSTADAAGGASLAERATAAAERCGSSTAFAQAAYANGFAQRATDSEKAERILRRAADLGDEAGNRWIRAFALTEVAWPSAQQGRVTDGLRGFAEVIDLWYRGGDWANQCLSMSHVLGILTDLGAHEAAAVLHGALVAAGAAAALPFEPGDAEQLAAEANRARSGGRPFLAIARPAFWGIWADEASYYSTSGAVHPSHSVIDSATSQIGPSLTTERSSMPTPVPADSHSAATRRSSRRPVVGSPDSLRPISASGTINRTTRNGMRTAEAIRSSSTRSRTAPAKTNRSMPARR